MQKYHSNMKINCYLFILFILFTKSRLVNESEFYLESKCGDGLWDQFSEECDGGIGCNSKCICEEGYLSDGKGKCIMSCVYGKACLNGCNKPDICDHCDTSLGYKEDCSGCEDEFMYFGKKQCGKYNDKNIESCSEFFQRMELQNISSFSFILNGNKKNIENGKKNVIHHLKNVKLEYSSCSYNVEENKPYTYGIWIKVLSTINEWVLVEIDEKYHEQDNEVINFIQTETGNKFAFSSQYTCENVNSLIHFAGCISMNEGINDNIHSPRLSLLLNENIPQYLFLHSKYASSILPDISIYFSQLVHICSSVYQNINWNGLSKSNITIPLDMKYSLLSQSICRQDKIQGFWFRIDGIDQTIEIFTCNSKQRNIIFDIISINSTKYNIDDTSDISFIDCNSNEFKCMKTVSNGCHNNSGSARAIVTLNHNETYLLFVGSYDTSFSTINLTIKMTCPGNCEYGICSDYSGGCECLDNYVSINGACTLCGNGKLDYGEDCDFSVEGYVDSQCTSACNCVYGSEPVNINGIIKCAVPTCGNGKIDAYEECDGGYGCDHCVCVNGTKKYAKGRIDCILETCGNKKWDKGEECDGGDGCIECECQENWYTNKRADCSRIPLIIRKVLYLIIGFITYIILYCILFIVVLYLHIGITKKIQQEEEENKNQILFENIIIPFDEKNSQYIDIQQNNPYFAFSTTLIDFDGKKLEIEEIESFDIQIKNNWKDPLHFSFHSGDYQKYEIACQPVIETIKPFESITLSISIRMKCTTILNEKIPITIKFKPMNDIIKDIKKHNHLLLEKNLIVNQLNNSYTNSLSSSEDDLVNHLTTFNTNYSTHEKQLSSIKNNKKIEKFYSYLNLQVESALSTKLDIEEIHLQHQPIGCGTFGIVYRAEWRGVDVAIKLMKTDLIGVEELMPNFIQEAEMLERIRSPYIINFIGSVITVDTLCLVTEFCPSGSLRKYIKMNYTSDFLKVRFCQDIARGMEYLHENDILHRDLKTDNVLVYSINPYDQVTSKVTDFGTSRSFIESSGKIELQNIGTPMYMAPEITKKNFVTLKSDVYSFAICMLEIWLGQDPYDSTEFPNCESILRFVGTGNRLSIDDNCFFKDIIEKAWDQIPEHRPTFKDINILLEFLLRKIQPKTPTPQIINGIITQNDSAHPPDY
ncbi:protein tyrosine kinase domain containing protein [Entamoeba histolytica KU27]|uniref:Protein tyrosine kinase domain containing protein n=1 Tax=Entamoeba histolytica KU27 TaxID=885311 RepID=M2RU77_ENTHI|nr:protein tyrosine kinase domain containing protein [Entamoeba histolytica KU27]